MKKNLLLLFIYINSICLYLFIFQVISYADTANDYSVSVHPTENQISGKSSYFDLRLSPSEHDRLPITIKNSSEYQATFIIEFHTATTNINGIVDYTLNDVTLVGDPELDISNIVSLEYKEVTVEPNSSNTIYANVTMPDKSFNGTLLGGIKVAKKAELPQNNGSLISNEYQYVIAVQISESDTVISPKLVGGNVSLNQNNRYNAIDMSIENPTAVVLSNVSGVFTVKKKSTGRILVRETKENLSIAPNSSFSLQTLLNRRFESGVYTYSITLRNTQGEWILSKDFTISNEQAKSYNATSEDGVEKVPRWIYFIIFLIIILVILFCRINARKGSI